MYEIVFFSYGICGTIYLRACANHKQSFSFILFSLLTLDHTLATFLLKINTSKYILSVGFFIVSLSTLQIPKNLTENVRNYSKFG